MSNLTASTVQLSTLPAPSAAPAPEAVSETTPGAAPPAPGNSEAASGAGAPTKPDAPDPNLEISRKLENVAKREARTRRAEVELHEKVSSITAKEKQLDEKLQKLDAALSDPVKYMIDNGQDPVAVARRFATPETEAEKRIRLLEEDRAKEKSENERKAKEYEDRRASSQREETIKAFVAGINETEHPHVVALHAPEDIPGLVTKLLNRPMDPDDPESPTLLEQFKITHNRKPTDAEIRECLEADAESRATKILKSKAAPADAPDASQTPGSTQTPVKTESGPSGISNQHAAKTSPGKQRPLTLQEKRAKTRQELTAALEAEATD